VVSDRKYGVKAALVIGAVAGSVLWLLIALFLLAFWSPS
jgi:hypothetical protein